jgi:two-component system, LytTR family, response regulator
MESKLRVLITDDDDNARNSLRKLLAENFPEVEILGEASNVPDAVKLIHKLKPDLLFLDIDMPGHSGLELPDFFDKKDIFFKIVFITAHTDYAINAFELSATDYILKPPGVEHIRRALEKASTFNTEQFSALKNNMQENENRKIAIPSGKSLIFVDLNEIMYLKADGSYSRFYFKDGKQLTVSKRLNEFLKLENTGQFMRIHRSHIINLKMIKRIEKGDTPMVILTDDTSLPIASERKKALFDYLDDYVI